MITHLNWTQGEGLNSADTDHATEHYGKTAGLWRTQLLHFVFFKMLVFLHMMHRTEPIPCLTLAQQISLTFPILEYSMCSMRPVRSLNMCVSRVIKCLIFFNDLLAQDPRHQVQIQNTKRNHLLLCLCCCNPKDHLALSEFLNSTD